jgi:hypothetical protein
MESDYLAKIANNLNNYQQRTENMPYSNAATIYSLQGTDNRHISNSKVRSKKNTIRNLKSKHPTCIGFFKSTKQ